MSSSLNILIVGTGNVGTGLAKRLAATGHKVSLGSRTAERGAAAAGELGVSGGATGELAADADVIMLAMPFTALDETIAALGSTAGKVVVDATNPLTEDFMGLTVGHQSSAGEVVQSKMPDAKVVKAFNAIFADVVHAGHDYGEVPAQVFYASDHEDAKATVAGLISEMGYDAVDTGPLQNSRHLEPLAMLIIQLAYVVGEGTVVTPVVLRPKG